MSAYIDQHRDRFGVEPICNVLQFAPRTYYAIKARAPSARAVRDAELKPEIVRVHRDNFGVYGVDKVWAQLNREGTRVARCTVARLMRELGLRGVVRGKPKYTTVAGDAADRPRDLVDRRFKAGAPDRLILPQIATFPGCDRVNAPDALQAPASGPSTRAIAASAPPQSVMSSSPSRPLRGFSSGQFVLPKLGR